MKKYYITTPIYYSNWIPHIGHSYSSLLADAIARSKRALWYQVKFSTGVDENSQKAVIKAEEEWKNTMEYLDEMSSKHKAVWDGLDITYTDFIRTTSEKHHKFVRSILDKVYKNGDIYQWEYKWLYCIGCEAFKKETDLIEKNGKKVCPDHLTEPDKLVEKNWFFSLSKYENKLKDFYRNNPDFVKPSYRFNEIKAFVEGGLEDFSISRETNTFGIKLPFDESSVSYVWFDALINYLTLCQDDKQDFWPANIHIMAKDIARFHAIYWPAMLMSAWYKLPKNEIVTGFLTVDGQKISKSLGNVIDPVEFSKKYSRDALVLYLFYDVKVGNDADFSWERFKGLYDSMLIGGWWNLVFRVSKMAQKNKITEINANLDDLKHIDNKLLQSILEGNTTNLLEKYIEKVDLQNYIRNWYDLVQATNKYIEETQPWKLLKKDENAGKQVLQNLVWLVEKIGILSAPLLIESWGKIQNIFDRQIINTKETMEEWKFQKLLQENNFTVNISPEIIYKKVEE